MSQQIIHIPALLTAEELTAIDSKIGAAQFNDGKITAGLAAREVKKNTQLASNDPALMAIQESIRTALGQSPLFNIAALPKEIFPFIISKYEIGDGYGWHVDSPIMESKQQLRSDLAMTIFLSEPSSYTGGELVINMGGLQQSFKPAKGDAILYPCQYLHCVSEVTSGVRIAAITWIQSNVKDAQQRQILFELNQVHGALYQQAPNAPATNLLLQTHSNLFRMWAEL